MEQKAPRHILTAAPDWISICIFSSSFVHKEYRQTAINIVMSIMKQAFEPVRGRNETYASEYRYISVNSAFLLLQWRGWEWTQKGFELLPELMSEFEKIKTHLLSNGIEVRTSGITRLDLQITFTCDEAMFEKIAEVREGTGPLRYYYRLKDRKKKLLGMTLRGQDWFLRIYHKGDESRKDPKKHAWLTQLCSDKSISEDRVYRLEVQIDKNIQRFWHLLEEYARTIYNENKEQQEFALMKQMLLLFNKRLRFESIACLLGNDLEGASLERAA